MKKLYFLLFLAAFLISHISVAQCTGKLVGSYSPNTICTGDSITITANINSGNAGWNFTIYYSSISLPNKISDTNFVKVKTFGGKYIITADSNGCATANDTFNLIVTVNPLPVISVSPP